MNEAFQEAYLKEIGVQAPISSFFVQQKDEAAPASLNKLDKLDTNVKPSVLYQTQGVEHAQDKNAVGVAEVSKPISSQSLVSHQPLPSSQPASAETLAISPTTDLFGLEKKAEACKSCELVQSRNKLVFGVGSPSADLMFVGDSPSRDDDLAGLPIVGRSGPLFDSMLSSIGLDRCTVYLTNGVKCRPLHSRDPKPNEFSACEGWFIEQLEMMQPKMICLLGRVIAQSLLKTEMSLTELRQQQHTFRGIPVLVIDHPSYLLRSQQNKARAWADLCRLKIVYQKLKTHH